MPESPLRAAIITVTSYQQNCSLVWCSKTMRGALVDPGGDLDRLKAGVAKAGVTLEKILLTHGHADHCGQAGLLAKELSLPIEGPHEDDRFWISRLEDDGPRFGIHTQVFEPDRWLEDGDTVSFGEIELEVIHCPGHTPGHVVLKLLQEGGGALFCGDALHHPIQVYEPDWSTRFCDDPVQARLSRRKVLEHCAAQGALLFPTHFAAPHVAAIERAGEGRYRPRFVHCCEGH